MLREHGELIGSYPVWRGRGMKPFSHEEHRFLLDIAPHLATARLAEKSIVSREPDQFSVQIRIPGRSCWT